MTCTSKLEGLHRISVVLDDACMQHTKVEQLVWSKKMQTMMAPSKEFSPLSNRI